MSKYRKKPVVVEAVQFSNELAFYAHISIPQEFKDACCVKDDVRGALVIRPHIHTLESEAHGAQYITLGDWIIKGVKGEFYPCKPDIFDATYELIPETHENG